LKAGAYDLKARAYKLKAGAYGLKARAYKLKAGAYDLKARAYGLEVSTLNPFNSGDTFPRPACRQA